MKLRSRPSDAMLNSAAKSILKVGHGRGFLVDTRRDRLVITAAHCLPLLPPPHPASNAAERAYKALLGPLGKKPTIWAECLFVDPIADVAVLGAVDEEGDLSDEYERFVETRPVLCVGYQDVSGAQILDLDGQWHECTVIPPNPSDRFLSLRDVEPAAYARGTSGSPIISATGKVVGLISGGPELNPMLSNSLPGWLLKDLDVIESDWGFPKNTKVLGGR